MNNPLNINPKNTLKQFLRDDVNAVDPKGLATQEYMKNLQQMNTESSLTSPRMFQTYFGDDSAPVQQQRAKEAGLAHAVTNNIPSNGDKYKEMWSQMYQTTNDPVKEAAYSQHVKDLYGKAPKEVEIRTAIDKSMPAFAGELQSRGFAPNEMKELLYQTALHESMGGRYNKQINGPARSAWQVEPNTAYDNIQNYGHAMGKDYEKAVGYSREQLQGMSKDQVATLLETDPAFAASQAGLWYLRKMDKKGA